MKVSREEIVKIARLAHLRFEGPELDRFSGEFANILEYFESLGRLDLSGIEPTSHVASGQQARVEEYRPDETRPSFPPDEALREAPEKGQGHFLVPKFIA